MFGDRRRRLFGQAARDLRLIDQRVARRRVQIDADHIARPQPCQPAARRAFGADVENGRAVAGARLASVPQCREPLRALPDQRVGRLHVDHFGAARPADHARTPDDEDAVFVDLKIGIVDPVVVIVRPVEHDRARFEHTFLPRSRKIALAKLVRDDRGLENTEVEQVARQDEEACLFHQRIGEGADHLAILRLSSREVFAHCHAGAGPHAAAQLARFQQFPHRGGHAARAMEPLAQIGPGRLHVDQQRQVVSMILPHAGFQRHACMRGHRLDMRLRVGRSANYADGGNRVFERLAGQDVGRFQVLAHHLDDPLASAIGILPALAIGCGDRGTAGQRQAERFGHRVHRAGGAHRIAVPCAGRAGGGTAKEFLFVDLARRQLAAAAPDHGAAADQLTLVPAVEHRPAGQDDGGDIHGRCRHDLARRGLVAARGQHHPVDRIAIEQLHQPQIEQVAVERGGRPAAILEDRVDREFDGDAACIADAIARALRQLHMDAVARGKIAARLRNPDDRLAAAQLLGRDAVIHEPLQIERGHVHPLRIVEPVAAAQAAVSGFAHVLSRTLEAEEEPARLGAASDSLRTSV